MMQGKRKPKTRKSRQNKNQHRKKGKNRPGESKSMTKNKKNETAMMCWEVLNDFPKKEPHEESKNEGEKPVGKMQKHIAYSKYRQLSWETEDDGSTLDTQETEQQELVYIMNLKGGLQKDGTKLYNEEGPNNKKPAVKNRCF